MERWLNHSGLKDGREGNEAGQALVELALSMSLLFLMLLGAVEFARVTYAAIEVSNAARAAAQYGAMNGGNTADLNGMIAAAQNDSSNLGTTVTVTADPVTNTCSDGSTYSSTTYCGSAYVYTTLTVHTSTSFAPLISVPGFRGNFTLYGKAQELVLQ